MKFVFLGQARGFTAVPIGSVVTTTDLPATSKDRVLDRLVLINLRNDGVRLQP